MKVFCCATMFFILCANCFSQNDDNMNKNLFNKKDKCGTILNRKALAQGSKSYFKEINNAEWTASEFLKNDFNKHLNTKIKSLPLIVPVVFHVMYSSTSAATYLNDSVLIRQIQILNETYSLTNTNFSSVRSIFDSLAANTDIQFCLAGTDPIGNASTGIDRFQTSGNFSLTAINDGVKIPALGGRAAWDAQRYLNIWVCDMSFFGTSFILGYSTFPGGPDSLDGVVLQAEFVGFQNNGTVNNLGKTAVHEVGHWLGMRHIWGDGQQGTSPCDSTDYVEDTPHASDASATNCDTTKNTCSNEDNYWLSIGVDPPDMVENYMDYSNDACMAMFTNGQKDRMWSFISTARANLLTNSFSCSTVGVDAYNPSFINYLHIFPNPNSSGLLNLNFSINSIESLKVEFFNSTGQLVKSFFPSAFQNLVDVKELVSGIYFVKIANSTNCAVKKIIIQ